MAIFIYGAPVVLIGVLVIVPAIVVANLIRRLCSDQQLPRSLPWAGVKAHGGRLARARANLRSLFGMKGLLDEGHTEYSKRDQAYVLPHILTGPEVVLPLSQVRWLVEQPDTVLSQTEVNRQFLEADHTFLHPNIVREPVHPEVIRRELTHKLGGFADAIVDELHMCLEEHWGSKTESWREVRVYDTLLDVISRLSTRVFMGEPLCHNKEFLHSAKTFDRNVVLSAAALNLLPRFLKPILGPIVTAYDYLQYSMCAKFVLPQIRERLASLENDEKLPQLDGKAPNDYIQWAIDHALAHWDPLELSETVIARRLACLCFAAIQSSVISITNTLFDVASSPLCAEWLSAMRDEVLAEVDAAADPSSPSPWSKASLARMTRVDSALRESMRLNGFVARGIMKMVVAPEGVTLPDGSHVPPGVKVGVQAYSVHRDNDNYPNAERYDAFRFAAAAQLEADEHGAIGSSGNGSEDGRRQRRGNGNGRQPQALVSTSPTFLAFSHGPNACPGRFFAANQLKLTLAHIAVHYEIEPIPKRPETKWFVGSMAPPMWETLRVRRRRT